MELTHSIERYLLDRATWVPSQELCTSFGISPRQLRQVNDHPGLCSAFAISGDKGFKHITRATTSEWLHFKHRLRKHGISELVRVRTLDRHRRNATRVTRAPTLTLEKDTPQSIMNLQPGEPT